MLSEEDQATVKPNMHQKFVKFSHTVSEIYEQMINRQMDSSQHSAALQRVK